jgi:DNA-binding MarR family transcriptional regulator
MSEDHEILASSPLAYQILRLLESTDRSLSEKEIMKQLHKTKGSVGRALYRLKRMGLVEVEKNPEDGRSTIFHVRKKNLARSLLAEAVSTPPKPFRAIPFAMADLRQTIREELEATMPDWKIHRASPDQAFDLILQRADPPPQVVGLELKLGGQGFERKLLETIGKIAVPDPPRLVVLAVFGAVGEKPREVTEERITSLLAAHKSTARFLWLDRSPLAVDRAYIAEQIAKPILEWTEQTHGKVSELNSAQNHAKPSSPRLGFLDSVL